MMERLTLKAGEPENAMPSSHTEDNDQRSPQGHQHNHSAACARGHEGHVHHQHTTPGTHAMPDGSLMKGAHHEHAYHGHEGHAHHPSAEATLTPPPGQQVEYTC